MVHSDVAILFPLGVPGIRKKFPFLSPSLYDWSSDTTISIYLLKSSYLFYKSYFSSLNLVTCLPALTLFYSVLYLSSNNLHFYSDFLKLSLILKFYPSTKIRLSIVLLSYCFMFIISSWSFVFSLTRLVSCCRMLAYWFEPASSWVDLNFWFKFWILLL